MSMATRTEADPQAELVPDRRRYPWREWVDGSVWTVREGEDYDVGSDVMRGYIYAHGRRAGKAVRVCLVEGGVQFQFRELGAPAPRLPDEPRRGRPVDDIDPAVAARAAKWRADEEEKRRARALERSAERGTSTVGFEFGSFKPEPVSPEARYDD